MRRTIAVRNDHASRGEYRLFRMVARLMGGLVVAGCTFAPLPELPGDVDPCNGTCECRVDSDCPQVYTICNDQVTTRTCECGAGYLAGLGGVCEWAGAVMDPAGQSTVR